MIPIFGCSRHFLDSSIKENQKYFKKSLNVISENEKHKRPVLVKEYEDSDFFLSIITGIPSNAELGNTMGYRNKSDYVEDIKKWKNWFRINKELLTNQYIDSAYKRHGVIPPKPFN